MACSSFISSNVSLSTHENFGVSVAKTQLLRYRALRHSSVLFSSLQLQLNGCCKSQSGLFWNVRCSSVISGKSRVPFLGFCYDQKSQDGLCCGSQIRALSDENSGDKTTHLGKRRQNGSVRKRSPLRLRPRLRLLMRKLRRVSVRAMLNDFVLFLQKNIKRVTITVSFSVALGLCFMFLTAVPSPKAVPYSGFVTSLQNGCVNNVLIIEGSRSIYYNTNGQDVENHQVSVENAPESNLPSENVAGTVANNEIVRTSRATPMNLLRKIPWPRASTPEWQYSTRKISHDEKFLYSLMREKGTTYSSAPPSAFVGLRTILITVISLWIPLSPLMWLLYRQLSAANSLAKKRKTNNQTVSFDDVEGVDAAKVELMEIVSCLQGAINYKKLGAKLPRGVLLVGPPGTGKTLLARAVAGEAGVPFFSCSASEFVELFVGRGAARVRDLFSSARKHAPSIIFIDELDSVGGKRGRSFNDERDQTLNQLLTEMDGFESEMKVVVIAATNIPESLDPALCRPGRFSRKVLVGEPDEEGRRKILAVHLRKVPLEENIQLICDLVANLTPGFVGADLANIVNEAALLAARRDSETVTREDIMEAIERAKFGINDKQLKPRILGQEIGKLFPWMTSITGRNDTRKDGMQGLLGYQALS